MKNEPLKVTKLFVAGYWFFWDCFVCGMSNHEYADDRVVKDRQFIVTCPRCGNLRRARLNPKLRTGPVPKARLRKLQRAKDRWEDELFAAWDKQLKQRRKKR